MSDEILQVRHVTKRFPGVVALDDVSLSVRRGECHALVGENGAGKSTLGKVVAGIYEPDGGGVWLDGREARFHSPLDAARAGIGLVHQELAFCPTLSVAENLLLGALPARGPFVARARLRCAARECLARIGADDIDVDSVMDRLSIAQEQMVQIAAATRVGVRVLVLDEPTSSLTERESQRLFALMTDLKSRGVTLIYVSHRLPEIFSQCDTISVLRDGRHVASMPVTQTTPDDVVRLMIGRTFEQYLPRHASTGATDVAGGQGDSGRATALSVRGLTSPGRFRDVSFDVRPGEIVGLAGLVGAGRSEIAHALFGLDRSATGDAVIGGVAGLPRTPAEALSRGLGFLPEDRKRQGLILGMGGRANLSLAILRRLSRAGFIRRRQEMSLAREYFQKLSVRAANVDAEVSGLSGGNQQKVALARWLAAQCPILIVDEPTRGVDVGAKAEIHALLDQLAQDGAAILMISSELPELLGLSSRVIVLREGRVMGELPRGEATQERVMRLMAGIA